MKLELGSGYHPTRGFVHLDINPNAPGIDIISAAFPLDCIDDASIDELRAVDVLEHISYRDTAAVLAEWARVLRPGGQLYVQVPDADQIMRWYSDDPALLIQRIPEDLPQTALMGATWRLLGGHLDAINAAAGDDFRWNAHYAFFSALSLRAGLEHAGLRVDKLETNPHPNLLAFASKP